jgi:hypothetical protein
MKLVLVVVLAAAAAACVGDDGMDQDATLVYAPHDQVTTCDLTWTADGRPSGLCEYACAVKPIDLPCADLSRPCSHTDLPCRGATPAFVGAALDCAATFDFEGHRGCCVARPTQLAPYPVIPTFYECPAPR